MSTLFLTRQELTELTGRMTKNAQRTVLNYMGIEYRVRPDGTLVVLRAHVERVLGGESKDDVAAHKPAEPNWSAMYAPAKKS